MSQLCDAVCEIINSTNALISVTSVTGAKKSYRAPDNTSTTRSALLLAVMATLQTGDIVKLEVGPFSIPAGGLTNSIPLGVTGISIIYGPNATYSYINNDDAIDDYHLFPWPQPVGTFPELVSALSGFTASLKEREIVLVNHITVDGHLIVPASKTISPNGRLIKKGAAGTIRFSGYLNYGPKQVFSGFAIGDVKGSLMNNEIYPEWWGLIDNNHDIAINSAVQTSGLSWNNLGAVVKLGPRIYYVSSDIDLGDTAVTLEGVGSNITAISTTREWADHQWIQCAQWGDRLVVQPNHGSMIWIGAKAQSPYSYRTKVKGIDLNATYAGYTHWDNYRISCISSRGGVEENSVIHDVTCSGYTGFGIGFDEHRNPVNNTWAGYATVNGLDISASWIMSATKRDARPVYFSQWTNNCNLRTTTVDVGLAKSISALYGTAGPAGGTGDTAVYPAPERICDYPEYAIVAQGNVTITDVHIEGAITGVLIKENSGASNVNINNLKCFAMMDPALGSVYELDGFNDYAPGARPPVNANIYDYSCAVMFAGNGKPPTAYPNENWKACATLTNICILGTCSFMLRDAIYNIHQTPFDMNQFPEGGLGGRIAFYTRGNAWITPGGVNVYDHTAPPSDRTYFIGPIY